MSIPVAVARAGREPVVAAASAASLVGYVVEIRREDEPIPTGLFLVVVEPDFASEGMGSSVQVDGGVITGCGPAIGTMLIHLPITAGSISAIAKPIPSVTAHRAQAPPS